MRRASIAAACAAFALACTNAGSDRLTAVSQEGIVKAIIYFDVDGSRSLTAGDDSVKSMTVRLVTLNGRDTVGSGTTTVSGLLRITGVPVGTYKVVLDTTPLLDTATIASQDSSQVTVLPADSTGVIIGVGYPHVTIAQARTAALYPLGRKLWVQGIVLNSPASFRDTTMHVQDNTAAIRATRVIATAASPADSVRLRGTTSTRAGQRTLDVVTVFVVGPSFLPSATTVTAQQAATAAGGTRDAQQLFLST